MPFRYVETLIGIDFNVSKLYQRVLQRYSSDLYPEMIVSWSTLNLIFFSEAIYYCEKLCWKTLGMGWETIFSPPIPVSSRFSRVSLNSSQKLNGAFFFHFFLLMFYHTFSLSIIFLPIYQRKFHELTKCFLHLLSYGLSNFSTKHIHIPFLTRVWEQFPLCP